MRTRPLLLICATLLLAAPAAGQVRLVGRVIDDVSEKPLQAAAVTLLTHDGTVLARHETLEAGMFEFDVDAQVPAVRLEIHRLSYKANVTPVLHFDGRRFFQLEVRLDPDAILLAPLEVIARSPVDPSPLLDDFRHRLRTGNGYYITRDQVEARNPMYVTDLLRSVPGLTVTGTGSGLRPMVSMARSFTSDCVTQIWVDGFLINKRMSNRPEAPGSDFRIDDVVAPSSVEGIEIYGGLSSVPPEFLNEDARCGVVAIWTRRGGRGGL